MAWGSAGRAQRAEQERREQLRALFADPTPAPKSRWVRDGLDVGRRAAWRARRILTPAVVLAVVAGSGGVVLARSVPVPAIVFLAAVTAGVWWWFRADRLDRAVERRYALTCLAAAVAWLAWTAATGPSWTVLVIGWTVLSAPWVRHHWPRPRLDAPEIEPVGDPIIALWDAHVADPAGPLPGARLVDPVPFEHGTEYRVLFVPGRQPIDQVLGKIPAITQGVRTPIARVVLEQHPDYEDPAVGRLRHMLVSPVRDTQWFHGPRWDDQGRILLGPYADGVGDAVWRTYVRNGLYGGFLLGAPGFGKTRLLELLAVSVRAMSAVGWPTVLIYLDGQDGASSPLLWKHSSIRGGPREADEILDGLEHNLRLRQQWNRVHGLSGFAPGRSPDGGRTPGLPGVLCVVDECHNIWSDGRTAKRWAGPAREGRKVGEALIGADQGTDLEVFGGQEVLRSSLYSGNGMAMHSPSLTAGGLVPGFAMPPSQIPAIPGFGYKIAAPGSGERTASLRASYLPDAQDALDDPDLPVPTVEEWLAKTADAPMDDMTARAFGSLYTDREAREEAARTAALAEIEGRPGVGERERIVIDSPVKRTTEDVIMECLAQGSHTRAQIAAYVLEHHGTGADAVKQALQRLLTDGRVRRTGHGVYERTDATGVAA